MSYPEAIQSVFNVNPKEIKTIDIREDSLAEVKDNYLNVDLDYNPSVIITNPPFNISEQVIRKSLDDVANNGWVIMLLRLNYLEGKGRFNGLWKDIGLPKYIFVHHKRLSFTDDGKTDSVAYCHMVFQKGYQSEFTQLKVI